MERLREGLWAPRDGPAAHLMRRQGVEMFDCDPFLRARDENGDKYAPLPPAEELVGAYDVVFLKWETEAASDWPATGKVVGCCSGERYNPPSEQALQLRGV